MGQRITGKGYENTDYYRNCQIDFLDIHNIHKVSEAFRKIQAGVLNDANMLFSQLDQAGWYEHVVSLLQGAVKVVQTLIVIPMYTMIP